MIRPPCADAADRLKDGPGFHHPTICRDHGKKGCTCQHNTHYKRVTDIADEHSVRTYTTLTKRNI